jgi:hypothetical protein
MMPSSFILFFVVQVASQEARSPTLGLVISISSRSCWKGAWHQNTVALILWQCSQNHKHQHRYLHHHLSFNLV